MSGSIWVSTKYVNKVGADSTFEMTTGGSVTGGFPMTTLGLGVDSAGCIWMGPQTDDSIYQRTQSGSYISSFYFRNLGGLEVDSNDCIWAHDNVCVYQTDNTGSQISSFSFVSHANIGGIGFDDSGCIWMPFNDGSSSQWDFVKYNKSGSTISSFTRPSSYAFYGVDGDNNGCIWACDGIYDNLHQQTQQGSVVSSFSSPSAYPRGLGIESVGGTAPSAPTSLSAYLP